LRLSHFTNHPFRTFHPSPCPPRHAVVFLPSDESRTRAAGQSGDRTRDRNGTGSHSPGNNSRSSRGSSRDRNRDRDRDRHRHRGLETDPLRDKRRSNASKSYSPQGLNDNDDVETDTLQITSQHAIGFILLSSAFLLIMYFVDIYFFVSILYLVSAGYASSKVFFHPFFMQLQRTYTAIKLDVQIEDVTEQDVEDEICGTALPVVLSG
jgi:hypothetical protein